MCHRSLGSPDRIIALPCPQTDTADTSGRRKALPGSRGSCLGGCAGRAVLGAVFPDPPQAETLHLLGKGGGEQAQRGRGAALVPVGELQGHKDNLPLVVFNHLFEGPAVGKEETWIRLKHGTVLLLEHTGKRL